MFIKQISGYRGMGKGMKWLVSIAKPKGCVGALLDTLIKNNSCHLMQTLINPSLSRAPEDKWVGYGYLSIYLSNKWQYEKLALVLFHFSSIVERVFLSRSQIFEIRAWTIRWNLNLFKIFWIKYLFQIKYLHFWVHNRLNGIHKTASEGNFG